MQRRFERLGAWLGSVAVLLASSVGPLVPSASAQAPDPAPDLTIAVDTDVVINEVVPNASTESVEIYNKGTAAVDISGWRVRDALDNSFGSAVPASTSLAAGAFYVFNSSSSVLNNTAGASGSADTVKLLNAALTQIDTVGYGTAVTDTVRIPAASTSFGRVNDGTSSWYTGLVFSSGASNQLANPTRPGFPTGSSVKAGTGNAAHVINLANRTAVSVDITLGATSAGTDTVTAELFDGTSPNPVRKTGTTSGTSGAGTATVTGIDTTATPSQIDGAITVRSFVTATGGISTGYVTGTPATRDTVAPADPTAASILAGTTNATNVINSASAGSVSTSVTLSSSTLATDTVRVDLTSGSTTVSASQTAPAGGGVVTVTDEFLIHAIDARTLSDGSVAVKATLIDAAGNASPTLTGSTATKDTVAPSAAAELNSGASVSSRSTLTLGITASDVGTGVTEMRISNSADFADASFEPLATQKTWTLVAGEGTRTVYLQVRDAAGNSSATASDTILVDADAVGITLVALATGSQTVRQLPLEATVTATSPTTLTFASYLSNPGAALPTGTVSLPGFWEIGLADATKITFPVQLRLYYTGADLAAAGITSESQLQGLAYFDTTSQTWKYFETTGASTADLVVDGVAYAGYLFATTNHLTPIVGLADITPPPAPATLTATGSDHSVELSWSAASETASYVVRYRAVGDPNGAYFEVTVSSSTTSTRVTNLENGRRYEFGIATVDAAGNRSSFTTALATAGTPAPEKPAVLEFIAPPARAAAPSRPVTPRVEPTPTPTTTAAPEETPAPEDRDLSRLLITLAILIIAIGAGTAGYYGYQWWASRSSAPPGAPPSGQPPHTPPPSRSPSTPPAPGPTIPPSTPSTPAAPPESPSPPEPPAHPADKPQPPSGRW